MNNEQKYEIIEAAKSYLADTGLTQQDIASLSKMSSSYISQILNGKISTTVNEKEVPIADEQFRKIANTIGYNLNTVIWEALPTEQHREICGALQEFKNKCISGMLICETGSGKTFATNQYKKSNPVHTYMITVSEAHSPNDIIDEMISLMKLDGKGRQANKIERVATHLRKLKFQEENVQIIVDEGENMRKPHFNRMKSLYDKWKPYASIVIIGTPKLTHKMNDYKERDLDGMPQFCRRFKANTRYITPIDRSYQQFMDKYNIPKGLRTLLRQLCDNYGELSDYLYPVMQEAHEQKKPLTEDFFRLYHNMQK